jgi:hypothetical protein
MAALGCNREATPGPEIREPAAPIVPVPDVPHTLPAPPPASDPTPPAPPPFLLTEVAPTQGDLVPLLRAQVDRARDKQLRPLIEFYADCCPPCRAFPDNLGDPRMVDALRGTYLIKLNLDDWHEKLQGTGFVVRSIPAFYLVGPDGRPTGKMLDGDKWGQATPANMSASLSNFLGHGAR